MNKKDSIISMLLLEVLRGYSKIKFKEKTFYLKHFTVYEGLTLVEFELEAFDSAITKGIKGEDDLLKLAVDRDQWSKTEEDSIKTLEWTISKSEKALSKMSDPFAKRSFLESIKGQKKELKELQEKRQDLINHSAERLAQRKRYHKEITQSIYLDQEMTENIDQNDLFSIIDSINEKVRQLSDRNNLIKMAFSPSFFDNYCIFNKQPDSILKKDIFEISVWQRNILYYASHLYNKLRNCEMSDDIKQDPIKIYNFNPNTEEKESNVIHGVSDLRSKIAKNGGKLGAEDF